MGKPIAFIIGAGPRIGAATSKALQSKGYRVALAARSLKPENSTSDTLLLSLDLSNPDSVSPAFATLRKEWGEPSVVFYNAAAAHFTSASDPLATSLSDFTTDLTINTTSLYAVMQESQLGFDSLPTSDRKGLFYTGNKLNTAPAAGLLTLGVGKAASAHLVELAAGAFGEKGYGFFYVDERKADGASKGMAIDGEAHGEFIVPLIENEGQVPWHATFVAGEGYVKFPRSQL